LEDIASAALVSRAWRDGAKPMQSVAAVLDEIKELRLERSKLVFSKFKVLLAKVSSLPPRCILPGLLDLTTLQTSIVSSEDWSDAFTLLLQAISTLPPAERRVALCATTKHLAMQFLQDVKTEQSSTDDDAFLSSMRAIRRRLQKMGASEEEIALFSNVVTELPIVDMLIAAAQSLPLESQALVLAALCDKIGKKLSHVQVAKAAAAWSEQAVKQQEALGFARRIYDIAVSGASDEKIGGELNRFGYYRLPVIIDPCDDEKVQAQSMEFGASVMRLGLSRPEQLKVLMCCNRYGTPFFSETWQSGHIKSCDFYILAMQSLGLCSDDIATLMAGYGPDGAPLLNTLLWWLGYDRVLDTQSYVAVPYYSMDDTSLGRRLELQYDERRHWISLPDRKKLVHFYIDRVVRNTVLPLTSKIALLRAREMGPQSARFHGMEQPREIKGDFQMGPDGPAQFYGLSAIDSLFHEKSAKGLEFYIVEILLSTLPDQAKFEILRLDHPERVSLPDMFWASRAYGKTIDLSKLPLTMKQELLKDMPIKAGEYIHCTVL
jgi:hypothetical protein